MTLEKESERSAAFGISFFAMLLFTFAFAVTIYKTKLKLDASAIITIISFELSFIVRTVNWIVYFHWQEDSHAH